MLTGERDFQILTSKLCSSKVKVKVIQSCPTLCNPMDYTVHGIFQARILEWGAIAFYAAVTNKVKVKVAQSCPTLCDPVDYTVHGILQARILEWVAISFSRGSSQPRDRTRVSCIIGRLFTI